MDLNKVKFVGLSGSRKSSQRTGTAVCSVSVDADRPSHTSDVSQCEAAAPVLDWLCVLRLEQYSEAFYGAGMNTLQKCRNLSADQLEQMGIALPGHRRRILASVNKSDGAGDPPPQVVLSEGGQGGAETGHENAEQGERPAFIPVEEKTLQKERGKPAPKDRLASIMREEGGRGGEKQSVLDSRGGLEEEEAGGAHGGREKPVPKERTKFRCGSSMDRNPAPPVAPASDACLPPVPPRSTPNCPPQPFTSPPLAQPPASPLLDRYAPVVQNRSLSLSSAHSNAQTHHRPQTHAPPILPSGQTGPQVSAIQPPARHSGGDGGSQTSPTDDRNAPPLPAKAGVIPKVPPPVPQRSPSVSTTKTVADEMQKVRTPLLPPRIKSREEPPRSGPPDVQQTVPPKMPPPPEAGLTNSELPGGTELFWFSPPGTGLDPLTGSEDHQDPDQMKLPDLDSCLQKTGPPKGANGSLSSENVDDDEPTLWQDGTLSVSEEDGSQVPAVIKMGWLSKSSPQGPPNYQRRWVKLDVDFLRYFDNEKEAYSKGFIATAFISNVSSAGELKLDIVTDNRTFVFRAESEAERDDWVAALKDTTSGRSQHRTDSIVSPLTPDCKGYLELKGSRSKLYTVVGADKVFLYKNLEHHRLGVGITSIDMNVGNVKETDRRSFDLITPYRSFSFIAESELLREQWVDAMREAIGEALSNSEVAEQIWAEPSNSRCADCGANKPDWASVNLLVVVCKQCAGEHRGLGPSISKVRSLKMDRKVWTKELIQVFLKLGNERVNTFWAASVPPSEALTAFSCSDKRRSFITNKYRQGKYRKYHPLYGNQRELDKALCINVQSSDVLETLSLIFCGADVNCSTGIASSLSPLSLASAHSEHLQAELLRHNINTELPRSEVGVAMEAAHYSTPASVSHNGFLFKTASGVRVVTERKAREDFSRRWCTLSDGIFSYYESDKNPNPNRVLKSSEIVCLAVNSAVKHGYEHTFELYSESERVYLFGTADRSSHKEWVKSLAKSFIPASAEPLLRLDFERIGRLKCKDGLNLQTSKVGWFALVGSTLHVYLSDSQGEEIHLRKLNELSNRQNNEVLVLVEKGRTLYIEAERKLDFSGWCGAIQAAAGSGGDTLSQQQLTETDIPVVVHSCIGYITRCGLTSDGIYRKSGLTSRVAALCERFRRDARSVCLMEVENMVDDVSNALKRFFRDLQEGVFTSQDARAWLTTSAIQDESKKLSQYRLLLNRLPYVNKSTLQALINHLYFVQRFSEWNQMNLHNLAIVFGPTLFQTDGKDNSAGRVIEDLIQHYTLIFEVDQQQLKRQSEEITAIINLQKNSDRTCPSEPGGHLICTVYLGEKKDTAEQHVKIPGSMTAAELCIDVLDRRKIPLKEKEYWSCWEFKDKEEMERLLHYKERVLPITYGTNTHLLVKKHVAMETMMAYLANNAEVSKHGVMKFREERSFLGLGRSFHDRYFIFNSSSLRMYKDVRSDNPQRNWSGKNLKVYLGIKKVLSPPTCWGLTVVCEKKQEKPEKQQWYLCCNTESEMWEWYATFLSIQYDGDVWPRDGLRQTPTPRVPRETRHGNVSLIPLRGSENEMRNSVAAFSQDPLSPFRDVR